MASMKWKTRTGAAMTDQTLHGRKAHVRNLWKQAWQDGTANHDSQFVVYLHTIKGPWHAKGIYHYFLPTEAAARGFVTAWIGRLKGRDQVWLWSIIHFTADALPRDVASSVRLPMWNPLSQIRKPGVGNSLGT